MKLRASLRMGLLFILALPLSGRAASRVIGAAPADPKDWPASVYAWCSATVVGERTLFIAAHCVPDGGTVSFSALSNQYSAQCTHSPNYASDYSADWALCLVNRGVTGIPYENVNVDPNLLQAGDTLTLTGYGCTQPGGGLSDGVYRVGQSTILQMPGITYPNYIITRGGAALCPGDSGGAAYRAVAGSTERVIVGINSRSDRFTTSYLASTSTAAGEKFIRSWSIQNQQAICGVSSQAKNCRGAARPDKAFTLENQVLTVTGKMKPGMEAKLPDAREALDWVMRSLN